MRTAVIFTCFSVLCSVSTLHAAPKPTSAPANPLLDRARQAVKDNKIADLAKETEEPLRAMLSGDLQKIDLQELTNLVAIRAFSKVFAPIQAADDRTARALLWLLDQPKLMPTLVLAVSPQDPPERVLEVLMALQAADARQLDEYADLVTALCVVWDTPSRQTKVDKSELRADTQRAVGLYRYLTGQRGKLRFDMKEMPWQLAVYVVDNPLSQDEIAWATRRYSGRGAIGAVYFDVPYDHAAYSGASDKQIESKAYTLQNLSTVGGICGDQAYYATMVGRTLGVPSIDVVGRSAMAEGHAWVGYLDTRGKQLYWNFKEGRYPELLFMRGDVTDPQTRQRLTESDVALLAALAVTKPADRLASQALADSAQLVAPEKLMTLYTRAINLSPGDRGAWLALADLGEQRKLTDTQIEQVTAVVSQFAAKQYPDFAMEVLLKLNSGRGTDQQLAALEKIRPMFRERPDLAAQIKMTQAHLLVQAKRTADAMQAYGQVLQQNRQYGPILMAALSELEQLLRQQNDVSRMAGIYKQTWEAMPTPQINMGARGTPYYIIGERYVALLKQAGNETEAARVQSRLDTVNRPSKTRQGY